MTIVIIIIATILVYVFCFPITVTLTSGLMTGLSKTTKFMLALIFTILCPIISILAIAFFSGVYIGYLLNQFLEDEEEE